MPSRRRAPSLPGFSLSLGAIPPTYDPKRELDAAVNFIDSLINDPVADHLPLSSRVQSSCRS